MDRSPAFQKSRASTRRSTGLRIKLVDLDIVRLCATDKPIDFPVRPSCTTNCELGDCLIGQRQFATCVPRLSPLPPGSQLTNFYRHSPGERARVRGRDIVFHPRHRRTTQAPSSGLRPPFPPISREKGLRSGYSAFLLVLATNWRYPTKRHCLHAMPSEPACHDQRCRNRNYRTSTIRVHRIFAANECKQTL